MEAWHILRSSPTDQIYISLAFMVKNEIRKVNKERWEGFY
jgi:hypothetical protein